MHAAGPGGTLYDWQVAISAVSALATVAAVSLSLFLVFRARSEQARGELKQREADAGQIVTEYLPVVPGSGDRSFPEIGGTTSGCVIVNGSTAAIIDVTVIVTISQIRTKPGGPREGIRWQFLDENHGELKRVAYVLSGQSRGVRGEFYDSANLGRLGSSLAHQIGTWEVTTTVLWRDSSAQLWMREGRGTPKRLADEGLRPG